MTDKCPQPGCPYDVTDLCAMADCPQRFAPRNPEPRRDTRGPSCLETTPASFVASGAFPFIGTAGDHIEAIERRIRLARASHQPVAGLLRRQRILKARCAALGACHG